MLHCCRDNMFDWDWRVLLQDVIVYAGTNPWQFVYYVLLCLSPFFAISAYLSWQLAKQIEAKEKEKKKKTRREANIAKARRQKADQQQLMLCTIFSVSCNIAEGTFVECTQCLADAVCYIYIIAVKYIPVQILSTALLLCVGD